MATSDSEPNPLDEAVSGLSLAVLVVYGVLLAGTIPVLVSRRHLQPLKFRDIYLLLATIVVTYIATACIVLPIYVTFPYCILEVVNQTPFVFMMTLIMARFWKLFLASFLTCARLCPNSNGWILRYPWMASTRTIWRGILALGTVLALIQMAVLLPNETCTRGSYAYWLLTSAMLCLYWISIAVMTWMLRNVQDGFFVVTELRMLGLVVLLTNVFAIFLFSGDSGLRVGPAHIVVSGILQLVIQAWYPLWKSYQMATTDPTLLRSTTQPPAPEMTGSSATLNSLRQNVTPLTPASSFVDVLRHPDGYDAMRQFLTLEFSVENILCWEQLYSQKRERRPEQVQAHFAAIYETFIRAGSSNEVNISSQLKEYFQCVIDGREIDTNAIMLMKATARINRGSLSPDPGTEIRIRLLRQLYHEIIRLMEHDSYQRFTQSKRYWDLVQPKDTQQTKLGEQTKNDLKEVVPR